MQEPDRLQSLLEISVPPSWPPELYDRDAIEFTIARIEESPEELAWWLHYVVLDEGRAREPVLIGTAGYKGGPDGSGTVEIGYGVLPEYTRRGFATEAVLGLVANAFAQADVVCVIAETLPHLTPSIGVLEKCGFRLIGQGSEAGVIRYELLREAPSRQRAGQ